MSDYGLRPYQREAVQAEMAAAKHVADMTRVRATWLRFVTNSPPGVFADGLDRAELDSLLADIERFIGWLEQARGVAVSARRPRRVAAGPDVPPPTERQAVILQAIEDAEHLLVEPEHEQVYYALSRFRLRLHVDPRDVAEVTPAPAQDAPSWAALAAWVTAIAEAMQARTSGLRVLDDRRP